MTPGTWPTASTPSRSLNQVNQLTPLGTQQSILSSRSHLQSSAMSTPPTTPFGSFQEGGESIQTRRGAHFRPYPQGTIYVTHGILLFNKLCSLLKLTCILR